MVITGRVKFAKVASSIAEVAERAVKLYDAVPMPLARLAGVHRAQLLSESSRRPELQSWLAEWLSALRTLRPSGVRWQIEVDPQRI